MTKSDRIVFFKESVIHIGVSVSSADHTFPPEIEHTDSVPLQTGAHYASAVYMHAH